MMPPRGPRRLLCVDVGKAKGRGIDACGNEPSIVRHIDHQKSAHAVSDVGKALEVDSKRIGARACDDELGLVLLGQTFYLIIVNGLFFIVDAITDDVEVLAGKVDLHAVGEVTAIGKTHAHDRVAGIGDGHQHRFIGLCAGVRLHVDGHFDAGRLAEELLCPFNGNALDLINILAAAVVALAWIAFSIFIGELAALSLHHCRRSVVLARNKLNVLLLALHLCINEFPDLAVAGRDGI